MTDHRLEKASGEDETEYDRSPRPSDTRVASQARPTQQGSRITMTSGGPTFRLGYLTGQYPRATDTFIQREVETLRSLGYHIQTFAERMPPEAENVGTGVAAERRSTIYLLPPTRLLRAHLTQLVTAPRRYLSAVLLAIRTCPPGL